MSRHPSSQGQELIPPAYLPIDDRPPLAVWLALIENQTWPVADARSSATSVLLFHLKHKLYTWAIEWTPTIDAIGLMRSAYEQLRETIANFDDEHPHLRRNLASA